MHMVTMNKDNMNLKVNKEGYRGDIERGKGRGKYCDYILISKIIIIKQ